MKQVVPRSITFYLPTPKKTGVQNLFIVHLVQYKTIPSPFDMLSTQRHFYCRNFVR